MLIFKPYNLKYWTYSFIIISLIFIISRTFDELIYGRINLIFDKGVILFLKITFISSIRWSIYLTILSAVLHSYANYYKYFFEKYSKLIIKEVPIIVVFSISMGLFEYVTFDYIKELWENYLNIEVQQQNLLVGYRAAWITISFAFTYIILSSWGYYSRSLQFTSIPKWMILTVVFTIIMFVVRLLYLQYIPPIVILITSAIILSIFSWYSIKLTKMRKCRKLDYYNWNWREINLMQYFSETQNLLKEDTYGRTPLFLAVHFRNIELIRYCITNGVEINKKDDKGNTVILEAARDWECLEMIKLLLDLGADPFVIDNNAQGLLFRLTNNDKYEEMKFAIGLGLPVNHQDIFGQTALFGPFSTDTARSFKMLIEAGSDVNIKNRNGETPLLNILKTAYKRNYNMVEILIEKGGDINAVDDLGNTALHLIAKFGDVKYAELLISNGAKLDLKNSNGQTIIDLATNYGKEDLIELFS